MVIDMMNFCTNETFHRRDIMPPVTGIVSPVMYEASSETRNATTPEHSAGVPGLQFMKNTQGSYFML